MKKIKLFLAAVAAMVGLSAQAQSWTASEVAVGDFYLYNVGAGKYLNAGDRAAQWGTNATLSEGYGLEFALEANGEAYNLNSRNSNGGASNYLATSLWTDGAATPWTFTAVSDKVYTISNGGQYLAANADGSDVELAATSDSENAQWKLVNRAGIIAAMASATKENPMNIRILIGASDFSRNDTRAQNGNSWTWTNAGGNVTVAGPSEQRGTFGCEFWNNTFDINQTLTGLPDGTYEFRISGYGTNGTTYIYGNSTEAVFVNQTSAENFRTALDNIADGQFTGNTTGQFVVTGGTLKIGVKRTQNKGVDWAVFDNADLIYYGLDLTDLENGLAQQISNAQALNGTIPTAAYTVLNAVVEANNAPEHTAEGYQAAISAIATAVTSAQTLVAPYTLVTEAKALYNQTNYTDDGSAKATFKAVVDAADDATSLEALNTAIANIKNAVVPFITAVTLDENAYFDVTNFLVVNPTVSENTNGWTTANLSESGGNAGVCNYGECEFYNRNFKFFQTLALTPGTWEFGVTGFHRAGNHSTYFYAGEDKILIPGVASSVVNNMAQAKDYFDAGNGKVALKFLIETAGDIEIGIDNQDTETDKWTIFRNFTLKYYGAPDYSVYDARLAELASEAATVEGTVPAAVYTTLNGVVTENNTTHANKAEYMTAISNIETAITTAKTFVAPYDEYKAMKAQVEALKSVEGYSETTSGATTTLTSSVAAADEAVNAATTAEAIAEQVTALKAAGKTFIGGVRSDGAHPFDITFLITNPSFDNNDATGWTANPAPGFQSFTNCEYYFANTRTFDINQTLTGMPKGNYELKVQAFQRPGWFEAVYNAYKAGTNKVTSVIYINEGQTTIKNLVSEGATDAEHQWAKGNDSHLEGGTEYFANSMQGAAAAFAAGHYWNSVLTAVEGDLKFGFKTTSESVDGDWTIFDNFQLYYYGNSINVAMDEAQAFSALADIEGANVTMARTTKEGINSVALPFDLTEAQVKEIFGDGAVVYNFSDEGEADNTTVNFNSAATAAIQANVPVLVKATKASTEIAVDNVTVKTGEAKVEGNNFDFVGNYGGQITLAEGVYFVGGGKLYKSAGSTTMKGFRASLQPKTAEAATGEVKLFIDGEDGIVTAIDSIDGESVVNGAIFNLAGQRVQKAQKGVYIIGGKKVAVK